MRKNKMYTRATIINGIQHAQQLKGPQCAKIKCMHGQLKLIEFNMRNS